MRKFIFSIIVAAITVCNLNASEVNVFAAANTSYAFEEIKAEFAKISPDAKLVVTLGSSGGLVAQIKNGAPADVFMAANMKFVEDLDSSGFAATRPLIYAQGALALFSIRNADFKNGIKAVKGLKSIAIAMPQAAPYGKAAVEALKNAKIYDDVESNIIYTKSISEALSSALSASDCGFIAASAMYDPKMAQYKEGKNFILINPALYTPIDQGIALLKRGETNAQAKAFYDFILSDKGKEIFKKYGYNVK